MMPSNPQVNSRQESRTLPVRPMHFLARWTAFPQSSALPLWYTAIFFFGSAAVARGLLSAVGWAHSLVIAVPVYLGCLALALARGESIARNPRTSALIGSTGFVLAAITSITTAAIAMVSIGALFLVSPVWKRTRPRAGRRTSQRLANFSKSSRTSEVGR